jgi:hypothetical protein
MFVRWLGAFGKSSSIHDSAHWEQRQTDRQVAVEPLWKGLSMIDHARIGLQVDERASVFCSGWLTDAYTYADRHGVLRSNQERRGKLTRFRDLDRFMRAFHSRPRGHHGEVAFTATVYKAVVVKTSATERGMRRAKRLAASMDLPLKVIRT